MKSKFLLFVLVVFAFSSCSKADGELTPNNELIVGKKFRGEAWMSEGNGQVYYTLDFRNATEVIYDIQLSGGTTINPDYTETFRWEPEPNSAGNGIIIYYIDRENESDVEEPVNGTITDDILVLRQAIGTETFKAY